MAVEQVLKRTVICTGIVFLEKIQVELSSTKGLHPATDRVYCAVILPLALNRTFTYAIPSELVALVQVGMRAEVEFGKKKRYAGLIHQIGVEKPSGYSAKTLLSLIDEKPLILLQQLQFWDWMASYYACSLGEIMLAALPSHLKLSSSSLVIPLPGVPTNLQELPDREALVMEALSNREYLRLEEIQELLGVKTIYSVLRRLIDKGYVEIREDLQDPYKPPLSHWVYLEEPFASESDKLGDLFRKLAKSPRQELLLLSFFQLKQEKPAIQKRELLRRAGVDSGVLQSLARKKVLRIEVKPSGLPTGAMENWEAGEISLSPLQTEAYGKMKAQEAEKRVVLLEGVTGSGKTRLYMRRMQEVFETGGQVLYLLPEISLSNQITSRLQVQFPDKVMVYHSRLSDRQRAESWQQVKDGIPLIVGARSALFLPFTKLQLIIIDEEHDPSFKQQDPNPRYQGRDTGIYLGHLWQIPVILGTATPSVETWQQARGGKYGWVTLGERYGGANLPEIHLIDLGEERKAKRLVREFSQTLLDAIQESLSRKEQVILFQNRRGFAPALTCTTCNWHAECVHCDVTLTYHQSRQGLKCHYCGYFTHSSSTCPACGSQDLELKGFGTEKIESELKVLLPEARLGRMDIDTVKTRMAHNRLIQEFEEGELDILIGTQMVTKGLDFSNVGLVGILSADQLMQFPDFRAAERAFQLMVQVSGRAGRRQNPGKVLIQALNVSHPLLRDVLENTPDRYYTRELHERETFRYPPFQRLIRISLRHRDAQRVNEAAIWLQEFLSPFFGDRLKGPAVPYVGRVRNQYIIDFLLKLDNDARRLRQAKEKLTESRQIMQLSGPFASVRYLLDVDPG